MDRIMATDDISGNIVFILITIKIFYKRSLSS